MAKHILIKECENGLVLEVDYKAVAVFEKQESDSSWRDFQHIANALHRAGEELAHMKDNATFESDTEHGTVTRQFSLWITAKADVVAKAP